MRILLSKDSGAAAAEFVVGELSTMRKSIPVTLFLIGNVAADKAVTVEYNSEGTTWVQCKVGGISLQLDADTNVLSLYGPGSYRVSRAADAGTVGVLIA